MQHRVENFFSRSRRSQEAGAALVGLAITLPLLVLIATGLAGFSTVSRAYMSTVQGARSGAVTVSEIPANSVIQDAQALTEVSYKTCLYNISSSDPVCAHKLVVWRSQKVMESHSIGASNNLAINATPASGGLVIIDISSTIGTSFLPLFDGIKIRTHEVGSLKM